MDSLDGSVTGNAWILITIVTSAGIIGIVFCIVATCMRNKRAEILEGGATE